MKFEQKHDVFTVDEILKYHATKKINLNPGFQRNSVWTVTQKRKLIDSLLQNMPIPTMFLWQRKEGNKIVYDVIDGKQRTEAILDFCKTRLPFDVKIDPNGDPDWKYAQVAKWTWKEIKSNAPKKAKLFLNYKIPVVLVSGTLVDIEQLFVRINSTGSKLTKTEMLHAKWHQTSKLMNASSKLAKKYNNYFTDLGILSPGQISRMKAIELIAELILSLEGGKVLNKKDALDSVMRHDQITDKVISRMSAEVEQVFRFIKKHFPDIATTRFKKVPDFYTLVFALWHLNSTGYVTNDTKTSAIAFEILKIISHDIAASREAYESGANVRMSSPARRYHETVISGSDSGIHRNTRVDIIESLLKPIFSTRASKRAFTENQKQLLWFATAGKLCPHCHSPINDWNDIHVDHVKPYARGGATRVHNGQLLHAKCNQSLGVKGL